MCTVKGYKNLDFRDKLCSDHWLECRPTMTRRGERLHLNLGASQARRRLKGHGFGVTKVETAGNHRAIIIHSATSEHRRQLEELFKDVIAAKSEDD